MITIGEAKSGIYKIENLINGKLYIGSANNLRHRKATHFYAFRKNNHRNIHLQRAYNKYGEKNFNFIIIEYCDENVRIQREQYYIDTLNPDYNILKIAGSAIGIKRPDQSIRVKEFNKNRIISEETKNRTSITLKQMGHKPTKECTERSMQVIRKPVLQLDLKGNLVKEFISINEACRELKMHSSNLSLACRDINKSLKGFKWKYKNIQLC